MNGTIRYTIRPYDTIWMLAQVFNTTVDAIMDLNPGINPRSLIIGQEVTIMPGFQRFPSFTQQPAVNEEEDMDMEELTNRFRLLWEQHVNWTSDAVTGIIHDLPETDLIIQRLLRNPVDFANALRPYFGDDAAQEFQNLLTDHITIAAEIVNAAKAGNNQAVTDADQRWRENAERIAELLASMNPDWGVDDWTAMLNEHLDLLSKNVTDKLAGNYQEAINGFDAIERQALDMGDVIAEGIALQFPD